MIRPKALSIARGERESYLDHGLAENGYERLSLEAGGGVSSGDDANDAAAEPSRAAEVEHTRRRRRRRRAQEQAVSDPRFRSGSGGEGRRFCADRHSGAHASRTR